MVNILDYFPDQKDIPEFSKDVVDDLIALREKVSQGFFALEKKQGHFPQHLSMSLPQTQDYARLIAFRCLEELVESQEAISKEHKFEELIDAINYLMALMTLDQDYFIPSDLSRQVWEDIDLLNETNGWNIHDVNLLDSATVELAGNFAESLRNRSWMNNAQDLDWSGGYLFFDEIGDLLYIMIGTFDSWEQFYSYFYSKNKVLEFRLESNY